MAAAYAGSTARSSAARQRPRGPRRAGRSRSARPRASPPGRAARPVRPGDRRPSPRPPGPTRSASPPARRGRRAAARPAVHALRRAPVIAPRPPRSTSRRPGRPIRTAGWPARGTRPGPRSSAGRCVGAVPTRRRGRLQAVDAEQLGQGRRGRRRRVDDRDPVADLRGDERPEQRVVGAAEQQVSIVAPGGFGKMNSPADVALAEQRRQRVGDGRLGDRARSGARPPRAARAPASRARRPRPPGSRP